MEEVDSSIIKPSGFSFPWLSEELEETHTCRNDTVDITKYATRSPALGQLQLLNSTHDKWMIFSQGLEIQQVSLTLLRDSWCLFKQLRLEVWVEHVIGVSSAKLTLFESYHDRLAFSLFNFLCHFPSEMEKYRRVSQVSAFAESSNAS